MSEDAVERIHVIVPCAHGIHMRVAAHIVELARRFDAVVELEHGDKRSNAESIMGVMNLGAGTGAKIQVVATGADAKEACRAIVKLFDSESKLCGMPEKKDGD